MNIARIKLLTFDVTNTLLKFKIAPGQQYAEVGAKYGIICDSKTLTNNFKTQWHKMTKEHPNFGLETGMGWEKWWKTVINGTFNAVENKLDQETLETISHDLIHAYKNFTFWQYCHGALDLLTYLQGKDVTMGIISNFDPRLEKTLENAELKHYFKFIITSYQVGLEKPDPKIFETAMKLAEIEDLKPEECAHVGDTPALDYKGAKSAGWNAVLISNNFPQIQQEHRYLQPESVYSSLNELHKHILDNNGHKRKVHTEN